MHREGPVADADPVPRLPCALLPGLLQGTTDGMAVERDAGVLGRLMAVLDAPDPDFDIVVP